MQIGALAKEAGVSIQTVRFYEREKILPSPQRNGSGYREYRAQDLRRLVFIRQAQTLGFTLQEIGEILRMRAAGRRPCQYVMETAERHLAEVEDQIRQLSRFRRELSLALRDWKRSGERDLPADAICCLIERTLEPPGKKRKITAIPHVTTGCCPLCK